jgi:D-alanyl-D-alanine carboxypeptidase (penicillin-binding protein 5/6)
MNHHREIKRTHLQLVFISLCSFTLVLLCFIYVVSYIKETSTKNVEIAPTPEVLGKNIRPIVAADKFIWPAVGQAALGSVEEGFIARSTDAEKSRPIASMAKVITALAIMEKQPFALGQQGQTYTITNDDIASMSAYIVEDGSVKPLLIGMQITQYEAMQRMLIASDNNMADILSERVFGSKESYIAYANDMLRHMGLRQTVVADASGFNPATVSIPSELIILGINALKNPVIAEIVSQREAEIPVVGIIKNTNELLGTDGIIGIKTGTTNEAGSCLLFAARLYTKEGGKKTIVGVIMGNTDHASLWNDTKKLLTSVKQNVF